MMCRLWPEYMMPSNGVASVVSIRNSHGNMVTNGSFAIAYDARSRLASVCDAAYTNGEWKTGLLVSNRYDHVGRRVKKITRYLDANGNTVVQYTYDAFGNTIGKSGPMCDFFRHRLSTKYLDAETGLYYYGYRFYNPQIMRWLNRDPIGEDGGVNMYAICSNNPKWGDGFASFVTHLRRRAHAQANEHRLKGFKGYFVGYNGMVSWPNEQTQMETVNSENQQQ